MVNEIVPAVNNAMSSRNVSPVEHMSSADCRSRHPVSWCLLMLLSLWMIPPYGFKKISKIGKSYNMYKYVVWYSLY